MVLSPDEVASLVPSGENLTLDTDSVWPGVGDMIVHVMVYDAYIYYITYPQW